MIDAPATATAACLQPATVTALTAAGPQVRFEDGTTATAVPAFAAPYQPQVGDRLLVAGEAWSTYAIGVLAHAGPARWRFPADAELEAPGRLRLHARELELEGGERLTGRAPELRLEAGRLELCARRLLARAEDWYRWVRGTVHDVLCRRRTRVDADDRLRAGRVDIRARGTVDVDGESINLG